VKAAVRRRLAVATWRPSRAGRIYGRLEVDATALLEYVDRVRSRTGEHVTITHVVGAALARAVRAVPEARTRVVLGRIVSVGTCDIGFAVDIDDGEDLAPVRVDDADTKSPLEICAELRAGAALLRSGADPAYERTSAIVRSLPWWTLRPVMSVASLLVGGLGVRAFGQPGRPLGTAFVSSLGTLGLDEGVIAPLPFARVPLYLAVGAVRDAAVVVDGTVVVQPQLVLVATADHRLMDGAHAGRIAAILRDLLSDPDALDAR
jgi:pyruvate dehydrogenase E2 component (dihydrolipoamide acetyltransferase)